jgi:hypothetical protein
VLQLALAHLRDGFGAAVPASVVDDLAATPRRRRERAAFGAAVIQQHWGLERGSQLPLHALRKLAAARRRRPR